MVKRKIEFIIFGELVIEKINVIPMNKKQNTTYLKVYLDNITSKSAEWKEGGFGTPHMLIWPISFRSVYSKISSYRRAGKMQFYFVCLPSVKQWSYHYLFLRLTVCRGWESNTQTSACEANAIAHCATAAVFNLF